MKNISFLLLLTFALAAYGQSPITIQSSDMPSPGDTVRFSNAATSISNYTATGAGYTWDFSAMSSVSQYVDTFLLPANTHPAYAFIFFNADVAGTFPFTQNLGTTQFEDIYYFYNKISTKYEIIGIGTTVSGIPVPAVYTSPDVLYKFPLNYGNVDSSHSGFSMNLPTLGEIYRSQRRINHVDGWGTLITPAGTYQTLRVRSELYIKDSISNTFGNFVINSENVEYKWLAQNKKVPVMQVNVSDIGTGPTVTAVVYQESNTIGMKDIAAKDNGISIFPNPTSGKCKLHLNDTHKENMALILLDTQGREVWRKELRKGIKEYDISLDFLPGIYFISITSAGQHFLKKLVIY